jgi:hypothetical protein
MTSLCDQLNTPFWITSVKKSSCFFSY